LRAIPCFCAVTGITRKLKRGVDTVTLHLAQTYAALGILSQFEAIVKSDLAQR
jgi:DNA-binding NarL/FixJ family response regulator